MKFAMLHWPFPEIIAFAFALPRMFAIFSVLPMFNRQALPAMLRFGVAASFAVFLFPSLIEPARAIDRSVWEVVIVCFKEALLGFAIGFIIAIPLWVFEAIGAFIDNQRGASIAQTLNPLTGHDSSPLGDLYSQCALVLLFISGGFLLLVAAIQDSYRIWPVFGLLPDLDVATPSFLLSQLDRMMRLAILLSAPVMFAMFLAEIGLALVSRFVPQLQVFFLAMPIKSGLAMFVLAIYSMLLFDYAYEDIATVGESAIKKLAAVVR